MNLPPTYKYYKIKLHNITDKQRQFLMNTSDVYRFCYNWGLNCWNEYFKETGKWPYFLGLSKAFTEFRAKPENWWLRKIELSTCRYALKAVENAFKMFSIIDTNRLPKFHSKKNSSVRFHVRGDTLRFHGENGRYVRIPGSGHDPDMLIDCKKHKIPYGKNIKYDNVNVTYDGDDFWLSLSVRVYKPLIFFPYNPPIGIDVGVRTTAALSDGTIFDGPNKQYLDTLENRRRKIQSSVTRDQEKRFEISKRTKTKYDEIPKSKNELKREKKLRSTYRRIRNIYNTHYHQISRKIADMRCEYVVIEDLHVNEMKMKSHTNAVALGHAGLGKLCRYIEYKCTSMGTKVIRANQYFPSTQLCSRCGNRRDPGTSKTYKCRYCGLIIDRDINAAINLLDYGKGAMPHYEKVS